MLLASRARLSGTWTSRSFAFPTVRYGEVADAYFAVADGKRDLPVPYHPNVTMGWDSTARVWTVPEFLGGTP